MQSDSRDVQYFYITNKHLKHPNFICGDYTYGNPIIEMAPECSVSIGKFCSIANTVRMGFLDQHQSNWNTTYPFAQLTTNYPEVAHLKRMDTTPKRKREITIGNDVWIGHDVQIFGGAYIGDGAIIGAQSIVWGNVAPYSIVGGNPAQFIRWRFPQEKIERLLQLEWWNWPIEKVRDNLTLLCSDGDM